MSSDYYLEFRRKSYETEQSFGHTTRDISAEKIVENFENTDENLLNDYELVINEELDENEENLIELQNTELENPSKYSAVNLENSKKLSICLGAEKIALKSQTEKTNKSIEQETETTQQTQLCSSGRRGATANCGSNKALGHAKQQQQQQKPQHVPHAFTIVPIGVANKFTTTTTADINNLPEIVLTSFETKSTTSLGNDKRKLSIKKPATVTFCSAYKNKDLPDENQQISMKMLPPTRTQSATEPPPPPPPPPSPPAPPEVIVLSNCNKETVKTISATAVGNNNTSKFQEEYNDDNEINSLPGSSTSPESYLDNILSAASSVSVRSSSLSSSAEVAHFLVSGGGGGVVSGNGNRARNAIPLSGSGGAIAKQQLQQKPQRKSQQGLTNIMNVNRSLNLKSTSMNSSMSTVTTTTPTTITRHNIIAGNDDIVEVEEPLQKYNHPHQHIQHPHQQTATLQPPAIEAFETNSTRSRSPSPSQNISIRISPDSSIFPEELKCVICADVFRDPRTLNCLHSYCFQCLVDENFKQDSSIPFWSQPNADDNADWKTRNHSNSLKSSKESSPEISLNNIAGATTTPLQRQRSSFSFRRKKSLDKAMAKSKSDGRSSTNSSPARQSSSYTPNDKSRSIHCKICNYATEIPIGGLRQLPQNFILVRKIEELKLKVGDDVITRVWCSLCFEETNATYHCITCTLNLCTLCKDAHERQRNTADHRIKNILELRKARRKKQNILNDNKKFTLKCGMHPGFEMKSFCITCLQVACADCLVLLHKGHKHELISKAFTSFSKILRDSTEQTRPLCTYAEHSIGRLNEIAKSINKKCDAVQLEVENFMGQYFEALEVHQKTLLNQVQRARESKVEMILEQQLDLEKRSNEAIDAVRFSQELTELGSDVEILSFVNMLLKRFEYCSQFKTPTDPKISEALHFLPNIRAPSPKTQNNIPLFGIITMQTVEPSLCTLDTEAFAQLRLHKKAEVVMLSRDADGVALCHGGLQIQAQLKYKEYHAKFLPVEVSDHRDGTYGITFVPDSQGTMLLTVTINDKPIKGSPFTFLARTVRPHSGIFHCCAFCSSKGNKLARCSCEGRMPGYNGCGHGHAGHPGRRHWSCCGNVLENSECSAANKLLNL